MGKTILELRQEWAQSDARRDRGLPIPDGLTLHRDIPYGDHPENLLDVYYPEDTDRPLPTIISIHGGGWFYGDKELYSHYCMRLAGRGFAVVNFTYRLAPEHKYPAALEDCVQVLHWLQRYGTQYCIDLQNLFTVGDSTGGQMEFQLLTMLTSPAYAGLFPFRCPEGLRIRACGMNCGCYFLPFSRIFPPKAMGVLYESYFPEDYMSILPQLKPQKYLTSAYPPAFVMSARYDFLRFMAPDLRWQLRRHGVEHILKIYGTRKQKQIGHVFHLNCREPLAEICNDEQCDFFKKHIV